jgi:para-aminobenzoate synthetase component I
MKNKEEKRLPYQDIQSFVNKKKLLEEEFCILFSSEKKWYSGKYSVFAIFPKEKIISNNFDDLKKLEINKVNSDYFSDGYFGYLSYDLKNSFEDLEVENESYIKSPLIMLYRFHLCFVFKHEEQELIAYCSNRSYLRKWEELEEKTPEVFQDLHVNKLHSNFNKKEYLKAVKKVKNYIIEGDIFEANLTRKFYGELANNNSNLDLFWRLIQKSPSQYSAYFQFDQLSILSSSPERFIKLKGQNLNSKPIKGTRKRDPDLIKDKLLKEDLFNSEKDRAENLMIVDLVRNDFGKIAEIGSIKVSDLFKIESYETVYQMHSSIDAIVKKEYSVWDIIKACFPPGSMTGAPKIRAMEICTEIEQMRRGIYSGVLGYIGLDSYLDLSVVIRTLILSGNKFEFQVGGAIVYDSNPEDEYEETLIKAKAISEILNINLK